MKAEQQRQQQDWEESGLAHGKRRYRMNFHQEFRKEM
jgi:hypothetical protein